MAVGSTNYPTSLDTVVELIEAANNAATTLSGNINDAVTTISVASTTGLAASGVVAIGNELISYTGTSGGNALTGCVRGFESTSAASHSIGADVEQVITARSHNVLASAVIAIETKLGTGSAIALNKLATVTASRVLVSDASGYVSASSVTATQLEALGTAQTANYVFAGPAAAPSAAPTFRALVANDIPNLSSVYQPLDADLTAIAALSSDGLLRKTGGTWGMDTTSYGTGTVTSVGLSLPAIFNVSNSPVTTSGTLTGTLADQNANVIFAGPSTGTATAPTFRSLVAADIPGVLSVTKLSNLTSNGFVKTSGGDGTLSVDTSTYLTGNQSISLSGDISGSGTTAITTAIGANKVTLAMLAQIATANFLGRTTAATGNVESLTAAQATALLSAMVGDSGSGGTKGLVPAPAAGDAAASKFLKADGTWATAGGGSGLTIGTTAITSGTAGRILYETSGNVVGEIAGSSADANGAVQFAASARSSGVAQYFRINTPADTGQTASTESVGAYFGGNGSGSTVTRTWAAGTVTTQRENVFVAPTYAGASATATFTTAATVAITGAPVVGANAAITNPLALWVQSGNVLIASGVLTVSSSFTACTTGGSIFLGTGGLDGQFSALNTRLRAENHITWAAGSNAQGAADLGINRAAAGVLRITNSTTGAGKLVIGSSSASTSAANLYVVGSSASLVPFRVDSAATPSVDIAQFTNNGTNYWQLGSAGAVTMTSQTANTSTVATAKTINVNSTGTAAAGFGGQVLYQLESSTTDSQTAAALGWLWTTATHASRTSAITFSVVNNAAALSEVFRIAPTALTLADGVNFVFNTTTGTKIATATTQKIGFWNASPVVQPTSAALTNNVTAGGTANTISDYSNLTVYATDAGTIRDNFYQLALKLKEISDALRLIGILG